MGKRKYNTEEERKAARRESKRRWRRNHPEYDSNRYQKNKEYFSKYHEKWRKENNEELSKRRAEYESTPEARALHLARDYKFHDLKANRGECTITGEWIIENIFTSSCHYCGESDWRKLGCDRIDNSKPHTPENCVPCCGYCNTKKSITPYDEFMRKIGKIKEVA